MLTAKLLKTEFGLVPGILLIVENWRSSLERKEQRYHEQQGIFQNRQEKS
jgi:hypothetical protein